MSFFDSMDKGGTMGISNTKLFTVFSSLVLVFVLGLGLNVSAQKGGHGNHGGGNGNGKHGGGNGNGKGNGGGWGGAPQGGPPPGRGWRKNEQPQQISGWANRPARQPEYQPRAYQPQVVIPQSRGVWRQSKQEQKQAKQEWKQERKAAKVEQREWRRQPQVVVERPQRQGPPPWAGVWTAPGPLKKAERMAQRQIRVEDFDYDNDRRAESRRNRQIWQNIEPENPNSYSYQPPVTYYEEPSYQYYQPPRYYGSQVYQYSPGIYYGGSAPLVNYYPNYGGDDLFDLGDYYEPDSYSFSDPFLGGIDWKNFLLSTVVNVLFNRNGDDELFGHSGFPLQSLGGVFGQDFGESGRYSPVGFTEPAYGYGDPFANGINQEIYDAGYEQGLENGRQSILNGENLASIENPYILDQAGFGHGASGLNLDQRRTLNEGIAQGYQDALANADDLTAGDGGGIDWTSAIAGGLLSLFNG
jgi:hypothetical protein